jgi:predicted MFS family arabinose efflux permease
MLGALGVGRLIGTTSASYLEDIPFGLMTLVTSSISAVLWLTAVFSTSRILTVGLFGIAWISAGINGVLTTTFTQSLIPEDILGRVSLVKGAAASATLPIGSLIGGIIGEFFGILPTMALAASGFGFIGAYYLLRTPLRSLPPVSQMEPSDFKLEDIR